MEEFYRERARAAAAGEPLPGWTAPPPGAFVGQPVTPPEASPAPRGRITAPLPGTLTQPPTYSPAPSTAPAWTAPAPAPTYTPSYSPAPAYTAPPPAYIPAASTRPTRGGVSGMVLTGMLALGLVLGSVGGGTTAWFLAQNTAPPRATGSATAPLPAPVVVNPGATNPSGVADNNANTIHELYTKTSNSVVGIDTRTGSGRYGAGGAGTGIVIDKSHVLTNYHVVSGASKIQVTLLDGTAIDAKLAGSAPQDDLALLTTDLPADKVQPAVLGDSDAVEIGDEVVAIGNPFGLDHTVTAGIVSAVDRAWTDGGRPLRRMIQTDTAINPGNSGGPLFNIQGQVIGITTAIESPVRGSVGVGFAIPINRAKSLLPQLTQGQDVKRVRLGISGSPLDAATAQELNLGITKGVLVASVVKDGPAAKAGLQGATLDESGAPTKAGDVVTAIDGNAVGAVQDITSYLDSKHIGETVTVTVWRDGKSLELKVTLDAWQDPPASEDSNPQMPDMPGIPGFPGNPNP